MDYHSNGCGVGSSLGNFSNLSVRDGASTDDDNAEPIGIPTGIQALDANFFPLFHGVPRGGLTEIVGLPGTGKTTFA